MVEVPAGGAAAVVAGIDVAFPGALGAEAVLLHRQHYINISVVSWDVSMFRVKT